MIAFNLDKIKEELPSGVKLVAVSKFHPFEAILEAYNEGQRAFGENRPQEFAAKAVQLPPDIEWHFIGHLQTNKLKLVLPYAYMVESIDTLHLLEAVNNWGEKNNKVISVLLEVHIGAEETKQGFTPSEVKAVLQMAGEFPFVHFRGLMGMASHTEDEEAISADFQTIKALFDECRAQYPQFTDFDQLSIGMSDDWQIATRYGSTEVRIGTAIFGSREY
ncbi:MAG: YggS family pyridoxal phosphate-dependent enzyme [Bacteroidales bacterium]|nr:YggS family pyridoxal phosphate-dependent enzyme [Bacteroidales bacterium]